MNKRESWMPFLLNLKQKIEETPSFLQVLQRATTQTGPPRAARKPLAHQDLFHVHEIVEGTVGVVWHGDD